MGLRVSVLLILRTTACRVGTRVCVDTSRAACKSTTNQKEAQQGKSSGPEVHQVRWKTATRDLVFDALDGETVRTAALRRGLISPHNGRANLINCRGLGTCGTCAVQIDGDVQPAERNAREQLRLSFPPHGSSLTSSTLRLACQVQVRGDIQVTKRTGFWGNMMICRRVYTVSPFGELESCSTTNRPDDCRRHY
jgi:ferredoxin